MSLILDIDLDYFRFQDAPVQRLDDLLDWAERPVDAVFEQHRDAFKFWIRAVNKNIIDAPEFILHVDEHHDMLGEQAPANSGNLIYIAMRQWPKCRVHWLVDVRIDSPAQWLSAEAWKSVCRRFTYGNRLRRSWRHPDLVTVATSPGFLGERLSRRLMQRVSARGNVNAAKIGKK